MSAIALDIVFPFGKMSTKPDQAQSGFLYDASNVNETPTWPERVNGVWQFGITVQNLPVTRKRTICMDEAFYQSQSKGRPDLSHADAYGDEMLRVYRRYFDQMYYGRRVPIQAIQHFDLFNGGTYWRALQEFASEVCGKAEVRCVTYSELVEYLARQEPATLDAIRRGRFPKKSQSSTQ